VAVFPLTGPYRASGLASNVFRRNAAHNFGVHATPAVDITVKPSRLPAVPRPSEDGHPFHNTEVSEQIASVESTESTVKNRCPDPLETRVEERNQRRADWTLLRYERNLCFFLDRPEGQVNGN
jgi:hypothetical protein